MHCYAYLNNVIETQQMLLARATPQIEATEAVAEHLRAAGLKAMAHGFLSSEDCGARIYVEARYRDLENQLEAAGLNPCLEQDDINGWLIGRMYRVTHRDQSIAITCLPPMLALVNLQDEVTA